MNFSKNLVIVASLLTTGLVFPTGKERAELMEKFRALRIVPYQVTTPAIPIAKKAPTKPVGPAKFMDLENKDDVPADLLVKLNAYMNTTK